MNIVQARNSVLNQEYKIRQQLRREDDTQGKFFEKIKRQIDAVEEDSNTENARLLTI